MSAATTATEALDAAAQQADSFYLSTEFKISGNRTLRVEIRGRSAGTSWNGWLYWVVARGGHDISYSHLSLSQVGDGLRHVAATHPKAVLLPASIRLRAPKGSTTSARLLDRAVQAWHEALGLPVPSSEELAAQRKAARASGRASRDCMIALLKAGPEGVAEFNGLSARERSDLDLRKADLAGCKLVGIDFAGANLEEADFSGATLIAARFGQNRQLSRVKRAKFIGANLSNATFLTTGFGGADFSGAQLNGATLAYGNLSLVPFTKADLTGANLTGADLRGTDFKGATLSETLMASARFDENTIWPKGFTLPSLLNWKGTGPDPRMAPTKKEKSRPRPADFTEFLERLKGAAESAKLEKALSMLKADRFRLFAKVLDDNLVGVVKSQSSPDLVYSCRLTREGAYTCCTQNLNVCGGLRGSPCKHLLVLIVGLAQAGELDPGTAHDWVQASRGRKAELDRDAMTDVLLQHKGAEAGEIDWRPTETLPEDFYAM